MQFSVSEFSLEIICNAFHLGVELAAQQRKNVYYTATSRDW